MLLTKEVSQWQYIFRAFGERGLAYLKLGETVVPVSYTHLEKLLADSGAGNLTLFIKKSIFSGQIKVVKIDLSLIHI